MLYENIVSLCNKKNYSVRKLEIKAGLGNGTIGKWKTKKPTVENLQKVAKVLGVSMSTLLKENG